jgi:hypothetical protein
MHHEDLLEQAAGVEELSGSLHVVREGLDALDISLEKCVSSVLNVSITLILGLYYTDSAKSFVTLIERCKQM